MRRALIAASFVLGAVAIPARAPARNFVDAYLLDYEVGPLYIAQNENRYGAGGTAFTAEEVGQTDNLLVGQRFALEVPLTKRNELMLVYAPLDVPTRSALPKDVVFNGTLFPAGTVVDSRYLFEGYRLSYLHALVLRQKLVLQVGLSAQIRNAQVSLTAVSGSLRAKESDIGLVGAVKARLFWDAFEEGGPYWLLDADAFSTFGLVGNVSGAIYDVALTFAVPVTWGADLTFRGRLLGGGADVPDKQIENWANFIAFTAGLRVSFDALFE